MIEKLWNIPVTWVWTEIKDLGEVVSGGTPSTQEASYWGSEVNWISPSDLTGYNYKTIARGAKNLTIQGLKNSSAKVMPAGSVHFSSRAPIGYVVISSEPMSTNQGFKSLVPADGVFNEYVYYYLKSAKQLAEQRATGTTFKEISGTAFGKLPFPLPPTNEQKRIVAKIEELFSELDKGIENLKTVREQLKVYRQAILKHALEGKLTADWRRKNKNCLEPIEQLLVRISEARSEYYQSCLQEYMTELNVWKKGIKKKGKAPNAPRKEPNLLPDADEFKGLPSLPQEWQWVLLAQVSHHIVDGTHKTPKYVDKGVPFISAKDINDFKISFEGIRHISQDEHNELIKRCAPHKGCVLITKSGTIGRVAVVKTDIEFSLFESVANVPIISPISPDFVAYASYFSAAGAFGAANQKGVAVRHLHLEDLRRIPIPLPPLQEQEEIVKRLTEAMSAIENLENEIESNLQKSEALRQSILKKAFSGKLVAQDPNDEPASVLLERIRSEKESPVQQTWLPKAKESVA